MKFWSEVGPPADPSDRDITPKCPGRTKLVVPAASAVAATAAKAASATEAAEPTATAEAVAAAKAAEAAEAGGASTEAAEATRAFGTFVTAAEPAEAGAAGIGRPRHARRTDSRALRNPRWALGTRHSRSRHAGRLHAWHARCLRGLHARHVPWRVG